MTDILLLAAIALAVPLCLDLLPPPGSIFVACGVAAVICVWAASFTRAGDD